jgi:hypothetical protein
MMDQRIQEPEAKGLRIVRLREAFGRLRKLAGPAEGIDRAGPAIASLELHRWHADVRDLDARRRLILPRGTGSAARSDEDP